MEKITGDITIEEAEQALEDFSNRLQRALDETRARYEELLGARMAIEEIAAHLGEVLWKQGDKKAAEEIWRQAAKAHPDNDLLRKTRTRFGQ